MSRPAAPSAAAASRRPAALLRRAVVAGSTIRVRLTLWYVALLALTLALFSAYVYVSLERRVRDETDRLLEMQARRFIPPPDARGDLPPHPPRPFRITPASGGTVSAVFDETGQ